MVSDNSLFDSNSVLTFRFFQDLQQTILESENFARFIKATGFVTLARKHMDVPDGNETLRRLFFVYIFVFQEEMILDTSIHVLARYIQPLVHIAEGNTLVTV